VRNGSGQSKGERVDALCRAWSAVLVLRAKARRELREAEELVGDARDRDAILAPARMRVAMIDECIGDALRSKRTIDSAAVRIRERLRQRISDAVVVELVDRLAQLAPRSRASTRDEIMDEAMQLVRLAPLVANMRDAGYRHPLIERSQGSLPDAGPLLERMLPLAGGGKRKAFAAALTLLQELDPDHAPATRADLERRYRGAR
jgi:hypothetical protein